MENPSVKLEEALEDLSARFLLNLPNSEFESFERLFFTIESAFWFYDDYLRDEDPSLPRLQFKSFAKLLFGYSPILRPYSKDVERLVKDFRSYKQEVPTCGAAMLNSTMDQVVLVKGWGNNARWGFPKGKIGRGETELQAAIREVLEETGYDVTEHIRGNDYIDSMTGGRRNRIFIAQDVPKDTYFETKTRKEISKIEWVSLKILPDTLEKEKELRRSCQNNYGGVVPFMRRLKAWIKKRKRQMNKKNSSEEMQQSSSTHAKEGTGNRTKSLNGGKSSVEKSAGAFGDRTRMTNEEREDFFQQYVREADKRASEMGLEDDDWPVPIITSKDFAQDKKPGSSQGAKNKKQSDKSQKQTYPRPSPTRITSVNYTTPPRPSQPMGYSPARSSYHNPQYQNSSQSDTRTLPPSVIVNSDDKQSTYANTNTSRKKQPLKPIRLLKRPTQDKQHKNTRSKDQESRGFGTMKGSGCDRLKADNQEEKPSIQEEQVFEFNRSAIMDCFT